MRIPAIFASDFDGTIFFHKRTPSVSADIIPAVEELRANGSLFGYCSGRATNTLEGWAQNVPTADFIIGTSGARIVDKKHELIFEKHFSKETAQALADFTKGKVINSSAHVNGELYTLRGEFDGGFSTDLLPHLDSIADLDETDLVHGISCKTEGPVEAAALTALINQHFKDKVTAFQNVECIDIVPKGCSKGNGLLVIKELLQAEKTYGIGDSMNDIPLLDAADVSFTFRTSPVKVREHATSLVDIAEEAILAAAR